MQARAAPEILLSLTSEEIERYARHIVLRDIGGPGQRKLKDARALIIGAGGLGAPLLQYLAAAGVGALGIVDDDALQSAASGDPRDARRRSPES
jgi:molybdopterin/thiamine biosynthesis adenylyltransferase